jgi:hypothetical protein
VPADDRTYPLATVLGPELADAGLRKHDRIELVANYNAVGEHATLCVEAVAQG